MADVDITWKRLDQTKSTKVGYRTIVSKTFELPDGTSHVFDCVNQNSWQAASILALTEKNEVIVARQFRPGPEKIMDELPGGIVDEGEDKEAAVRRELLEETGYEAQEIKFLGTQYYDGYTSGRRECFLATGCVFKTAPKLGEHEFIDVRLVSAGEIIEIAQSGKMTDPGVVLMAYEELQKIRG